VGKRDFLQKRGDFSIPHRIKERERKRGKERERGRKREKEREREDKRGYKKSDKITFITPSSRW